MSKRPPLPAQPPPGYRRLRCAMCNAEFDAFELGRDRDLPRHCSDFCRDAAEREWAGERPRDPEDALAPAARLALVDARFYRTQAESHVHNREIVMARGYYRAAIRAFRQALAALEAGDTRGRRRVDDQLGQTMSAAREVGWVDE